MCFGRCSKKCVWARRGFAPPHLFLCCAGRSRQTGARHRFLLAAPAVRGHRSFLSVRNTAAVPPADFAEIGRLAPVTAFCWSHLRCEGTGFASVFGTPQPCLRRLTFFCLARKKSAKEALSSSQAPYPSPRRKRQGSSIPLLVLSKLQPLRWVAIWYFGFCSGSLVVAFRNLQKQTPSKLARATRQTCHSLPQNRCKQSPLPQKPRPHLRFRRNCRP